MAISESGRHGDNVVTHVVRVLGPEKGNATIRLRKTEDGTAILDGVLKLSGVMSPTAQVYHSSKILEKYCTVRNYHLPNFLIAGYLSSNFCSFLVQGSWSSWGDYGSCSKTCGGGNKTRDRDCTALTNEASEEAPHCPGDAYQTIDCNTNECPGEF